jgi:predicted N-acetyltransferase YhbS
MAIRIAPEHPLHGPAVERVLDAAFGPGRHAKSSERVREFSSLDYKRSRVALSGAKLVGCCRIWPIAVGDTPALFLGPLAVQPGLQKGGLGAQLVEACIDACRDGRFPALVLVGRPNFFARFGFLPLPAGAVTMPAPTDPARLQALALVPSGAENLAGPVQALRTKR